MGALGVLAGAALARGHAPWITARVGEFYKCSQPIVASHVIGCPRCDAEDLKPAGRL
jgi:hypothetical protein